jgi:hypothetical protein
MPITTLRARQLLPLAGLSMIALLGDALATSSTVVYTVEGAPSCNSFSSNSIQSLSLSGSAVSAGNSGTASGYIEYVITGDGKGIQEWSVLDDKPNVNFVILTGAKVSGKQKSQVYHFGSFGTASDSEVPGPGESLQSVTFCYGLTGIEPPPPPPPEPEEIPDCQDLVLSGGIDESVVQCPESGERFIFSVDPYGQNGGIQACTCNFDQPKTSCDPAIPAGDPSGLGCLPDPTLDNVGLDWVPAEIVIFQNGTGYCYTSSSGGRICVR